jgi:hypothetical protein
MFSTEFLVYLIILVTTTLVGITTLQKQGTLRSVAILIGLTLISEFISRILAKNIRNSNPCYQFIVPIQCICWGIFFRLEFKYSRYRNYIISIAALAALWCVSNSIFVFGLFKYPTLNFTISSFLLISLGFCLFIKKLEEPIKKNVFADSGFLAVVGLIWFYLISFTFTNFHEFLQKKMQLGTSMRMINYASNYVFYLLILIAFVINMRKAKSRPYML